MSKKLNSLFAKELVRIDAAGVAKRNEKVIASFTADSSPKAIVAGATKTIVNSNDYLGLRHNAQLKKAEHQASEKFGTGPGAVRFISGSLQVHRDLEKALAAFHGRDDAMIFSSAFATNVAILSCLIKGQSKESLVSDNTIVISDELNHRSIIEGIRAASISSEHKAIFRHMQPEDLRRILEENLTKFARAVVVTDGIFSMLGEYQDVSALRAICDEYEAKYAEGVMLVVDDAHGVGCFGETGRGVEEVCEARADVLVGTMGKAFGADGGYVVGDQTVIDYLRESAATYIYSNSISPGTAGAALAAVSLVSGDEGKKLLARLKENCEFFKSLLAGTRLSIAVDSRHAIQPVLIGDPLETKRIVAELFAAGYMATSINYPVVPKGRDEIRVQISAVHTHEDLRGLVAALQKAVGG